MVNCSAGIGRTGAFIDCLPVRAHGSFLRFQPTSVLPASPLGHSPTRRLLNLVAQEVDSCRDRELELFQRDDQILLIFTASRVLSKVSGDCLKLYDPMRSLRVLYLVS